jgi:hypothetical protein
VGSVIPSNGRVGVGRLLGDHRRRSLLKQTISIFSDPAGADQWADGPMSRDLSGGDHTKTGRIHPVEISVELLRPGKARGDSGAAIRGRAVAPEDHITRPRGPSDAEMRAGVQWLRGLVESIVRHKANVTALDR